MSDRLPESVVPVLVVGAGPVGLALACELLRRGIRCRVVDRNDGPTPLNESRALAVWERTMEHFRSLGVDGRILARGREIRGINLFSGGGKIFRLDLELDDPGIRYHFPISIPQGETERVLMERLAELGGEVERKTPLIALEQGESRVTATVVHPDHSVEEIRAEWLVGCDGAGSTVRKLLNLPFEGAEYPERFLLADVRMSWEAPDEEATAFLASGGGAVAAFPLPGRGCWRLIDAAGNGDEPERIVERFRALLRENGHPEAEIAEVFWSSSFRIHRRIASRFRTGRCFLAGDAAHIHSPVGGQGMNAGIHDACNLAWKLALVVTGAADPRLLDSYQAERMPVAARILQSTDFAMRGLLMRSPAGETLRNRLAALLGRRKAVRRKMRRALAEVDVRYRSSPAVAGSRPLGREFPAPGERAPDVVVRETGEGRVRLFDLAETDRLLLLLFTGTAPEPETTAALQRAAETVMRLYPEIVAVRFVAALGASAVSVEAATIDDAEGNLHRSYGLPSGGIVLIRPDGYIGYRDERLETVGIVGYLEALLG